jgi:hypothetical protein
MFDSIEKMLQEDGDVWVIVHIDEVESLAVRRGNAMSSGEPVDGMRVSQRSVSLLLTDHCIGCQRHVDRIGSNWKVQECDYPVYYKPHYRTGTLSGTFGLLIANLARTLHSWIALM